MFQVKNVHETLLCNVCFDNIFLHIKSENLSEMLMFNTEINVYLC